VRLAALPLERRDTPSVVVWDGGAGTQYWDDAANWSGDQLPANGDDVTISTLAFVESKSQSVTLKSLLVDAPFTLQGGQLFVDGPATFTSHPFIQKGGVFGGSGTATFAKGMGSFGGSMIGTGTTILPSGIDWVIDTTNNAFDLRQRAIEAGGLTTWIGAKNISTGDGSLTIKTGGSLVFEADAAVTWNSGNPMPIAIETGAKISRGNNNAGITALECPLTIDGTLTVAGGTLRINTPLFAGPGTANIRQIVSLTGGTLEMASGNVTFESTASIAGVGNIAVVGGTAYVKAGAVYNTSGALTVGNADLTLDVPVNVGSLYTQTAGRVTGTGSLTFSGGAVHTGGQITGLSSVTLPAGKSWSIDTGSNFVGLGLSKFDVFGSLSWSGSGKGLRTGDGPFTIKSGGSFAVSANDTWLFTFGSSASSLTIDGGASFNRVAGTGVVEFQGAVNNAGTAGVQAGTLRLAGGGTHSGAWTNNSVVELSFGTSTFSSGSSLTGPGAVAVIQGAHTFKSGSTYGGAGSLAVSAGTINFDVAVNQTAAVMISGGNVGGTGSLILGKGLTQTGGFLAGPAVTLPAGQNWSINPSAFAGLGRGVITIFGNVTWSGQNLSTGDGSFTIKSGGSFTVTAAGDHQWFWGFDSGATPIVVEAGGSFKKMTGTGVTGIASGITSAGTVSILSGTLATGLNYVQTGGITTVNGTLDPAPSVLLQGGTLAGTGTIEGAVNNTGGIVGPGNSPGTLTINGNYSAVSPAGLGIELNGTAPTLYDRVVVNGTVTLGGTLTVAPNYGAKVGDTFTILDNNDVDAVTGSFTGLPEGAKFNAGGLGLQVSYQGGTGNDVTLTVQSISPPPTATVQINDGGVQRSMVASFIVTFSESVSFPSGLGAAFQLQRTGPGTPTGAVALAFNQVGNTVTVTFNDTTFAPGAAKSLIDGRYTLTLVASKIQGANGPLDGNGDGLGGDDRVVQTHRLFGDADGDGDVDAADFGAFRAAFGGTSNLAFDFDGDGDVDAADFGQFRGRFGSSV